MYIYRDICRYHTYELIYKIQFQPPPVDYEIMSTYSLEFNSVQGRDTPLIVIVKRSVIVRRTRTTVIYEYWVVQYIMNEGYERLISSKSKYIHFRVDIIYLPIT